MIRIAVVISILFCAAFPTKAQEEGVPLVSPRAPQIVPEQEFSDGNKNGDKLELLGSKATFDHKKPQSRTHGSGESTASLSDFDGYHGAGLAAAMIGLILAAGGGIGGGGILVPIYILIMRFSARYGIPLSNVTILGGALANNAFNLRKRHPKAERPMVDFDLVLLMEPPTIAGAVIGSILNKVLPEFVITTLLVLVLGATALRTWQSAEKQSNKEKKALEEEAGLLEGEKPKEALATTAYTPVPEDGGNEDAGDGNGSSSVTEEAEGPYEEPTGIWATMLQDDEAQFPMWKIGAITGCFLLVVASNMLKLHVTTCGSPGYWLMMLAPVIITVAMMLVIRQYLLAKSKLRRHRGEQLIDGDVNWNNKTTITYPALCTLSGLFAGMFGIGGVIVKGPLMIEMGVLPEVSAATAAFMIFYTASSATVTYASFGMLPGTLLAFFSAWVFCAQPSVSTL